MRILCRPGVSPIRITGPPPASAQCHGHHRRSRGWVQSGPRRRARPAQRRGRPAILGAVSANITPRESGSARGASMVIFAAGSVWTGRTCNKTALTCLIAPKETFVPGATDLLADCCARRANRGERCGRMAQKSAAGVAHFKHVVFAHDRCLYQRPAWAPPSTCSTSPLTWPAFAR